MRAAACIGLGLAGLLAGCGELRVRVDVLDPEHVRTEMSDERLRSQYRDVVAAAPGTLADRMDAQAKDYATEMDKLARRYDDIAVKLNSPGLASVAQGVRAVARPSILIGLYDQPRPDGVLFDVSKAREPVSLVVDRFSPVPTSPERSDAFVLAVEIHHVADAQLLHGFGRPVLITRREQQVSVGRHQRVAVHFDAVALCC